MPNLKKEARRKPIEHFYCVVCGETIPEKRLIQKSVTCSNAHSKLLKLERRRMRDMTRCRFCNRPCTAKERADYAAWRKQRAQEARAAAPKQPKVKKKSVPPPQATPLEQELGMIQVN